MNVICLGGGILIEGKSHPMEKQHRATTASHYLLQSTMVGRPLGADELTNQDLIFLKKFINNPDNKNTAQDTKKGKKTAIRRTSQQSCNLPGRTWHHRTDVVLFHSYIPSYEAWQQTGIGPGAPPGARPGIPFLIPFRGL
jgi:hypothetical protein